MGTQHHCFRRSMLPAVIALLLTFASSSAFAQGTLVALYPFSGSAVDASGNGHNGVVNGAILVSDRFGAPNSAYAFDGDDWIEVPHADDLNFNASSTFTINAWVKACVDQDEFAGIVAKGPTNTFIPGYQLVVRDEKPEALISQNDENFTGLLGTRRILDSTWHMLTLIVSAPDGNVRMYVDGKLDGSTTGTGIDPSVRNASNLFIGKERNSTRFAKGAIDDVSIFDYALSDQTIAELYSENGWPYDAGSGSLSIATPDGTSYCVSGSLRLVASGSLRYRWSPATGLSNPNIANPIASPTTTTTYTVTGMREDFPCGTTLTAQVTITVGAPRIDVGPDRVICEGASVQLAAAAAGGTAPYRYAWTPAQTLDDPTAADPTATPTSSTEYIVTVIDASGCVGYDTVRVDVLPSSIRLVGSGVQDYGSNLPGSIVDQTQSFTNAGSGDVAIDSVVAGVPFTVLSTTPSLPAVLRPGDSIVVTTRYNVRSGPDSADLRLYVASPCAPGSELRLRGSGDERASCRVYIPELTASSGEEFMMPLLIDSTIALKPAGAYRFRATVAFDQTLLFPDASEVMTTSDGLRRVEITGTRKDNSDVLARVPMTALLGRVDTTALAIESFEWIEPAREVATRTDDGLFVLANNCPQGGERHYDKSGRVTLRPLAPNPAGDHALVTFETVEPGRTSLVVVDQRGRPIATIVDGEWTPGTFSIDLDLSSLAPGPYLMVLTTPTVVRSERFEVVR